ncbi:aminoglycoside phosphotransferase [Phenylobacterium sp. Root77]|uniref:N-acetylmuramate/N-acetylglucosamine kinase AmgK n=1 Tax=unclassified Phenylobacterium TaxID=2640670 RepID=UPI0006FC053E|nr:aminoglycoside phosphotransferase [Phenylobacterium sp. Root1277]KQW95253.1 aminoglycoside phosphotransferase [Phenylobacterium sp. Root1290]KRC41044.1 aminoglycoside phosphotransferase [Phenylobacterium sp. Root77]
MDLNSDRDGRKAEFLKAAGLAEARRELLAGDASTRAYERLHLADGSTVIFMDQPPAAESAVCPPGATPAERLAMGYNAAARLAAGSVAAFVTTAAWLRDHGLSAPRILAHDVEAGLAVLEDLGDGLFATLIADGEAEAPLYEAAVDVQVQLQETTPPDVLSADGASWPLLTYDALALKVGTDTFLEWWPQFANIPAFAPEAVAEWEALWAPVFDRGAAGASVFTHRDFHAQNLLWLPERDGAARVGLLDFQDALRAHPAWDLTHLLQDARRDVSPELEAAMLDRFLAARPGLDREAFVHDYRALAASNAARILGRVFARQALLGRRQYEAFMPRTWRYLERNLTDPSMAGLKTWFDRHVPAEARR